LHDGHRRAQTPAEAQQRPSDVHDKAKLRAPPGGSGVGATLAGLDEVQETLFLHFVSGGSRGMGEGERVFMAWRLVGGPSEEAHGTGRTAADGLHLEADPAEQGILSRIGELKAADPTARKVADELNHQGFTTRRGTVWMFQYVAEGLRPAQATA
jgi:hypothetical protein